MELTEYVAAYRAAREAKDEAEAVLKERKYELEEAEQALVEKMVEDEVPSITVGDRSFSLMSKTYYSCLAENRPALFALLRRDGLDSIIQETVNANTLSASMREMVELNGGDMPEGYADVVSSYDKHSISMRRG